MERPEMLVVAVANAAVGVLHDEHDAEHDIMNHVRHQRPQGR